MKGLLLDCIYKSADSIKLMIFVLGFIGAGIIGFTDSQFVVLAFICSIFFCISACALISIRKDVNSKWYRYEICLPVSRKTVIKSKFLAFLFWLSVAVIMAVFYTGLVILFKGYQYFDFGMRDILSLLFLGVSFSLSFCGFFYVGLYLSGLEKCDVLVIISMIFAVTCLSGLIYVLNLMNISIENGRMIVLGCAVIVFIIGMNLSQRIYCLKEF